jgi:MFS family permease
MQTTALMWLAYDLTHESKWPAFLMVAMIGPTLLLGAWSGSLADRCRKHTLILRTQIGFLTSASILTVLVYANLMNIWLMLVLMTCHGIVQAIDLPTRLAFVPDLVEREDLINTVALNSVQFNVARAIGPAIAGALIRYSDDDMRAGENLLDNWGLMHACFGKSPVLAFNARHTNLATDARLVRTAKLLQARLLTNDTTLCQVARLQQVQALNLGDLVRALRPNVMAGDELELNLIKEGRDAHQAVGYLPDGTMIVVNHARPHLGKVVTVVVSSALQTGAGRLIFAELKENGKGA